jgi:hypothetical protein
VRWFRQDGPPPQNREIVAAGFFPLTALPDGTTAGTRRRLAEWQGQRPLSADWN